MPDIGSLKTSISELMDETPSVCLWYSGGKDSSLLLAIMLDLKRPFGILRFDDGWNKTQKKAVDATIIEKNLQVFSYPANMHLLVGIDDETGMVSHYAVDAAGNSAVLVRDLVDDPSVCAFDLMLESPKTRIAPIEFALHIWGTREDDRHWIAGDKPLLQSKEWFVGNKRFVAPLAEWTREDVEDALKVLSLEAIEVETGDIHCCHNCLKGTGKVHCPKVGKAIDAVNWDKRSNLELIRETMRLA